MERKGLTIRQLSCYSKAGLYKNQVSVDEILGWLLNISFALLMIFVIANFLFSADIKAALDSAKAQLGVLQGKYDYFTKTPKGEVSQKYEQALMDIQKEKLLLGLEEVMSAMRADFGLSIFGSKDKEGEQIYILGDILSPEGKVVNERFKRGCVLAKQAFMSQKETEKEIFNRVLLIKGMQYRESSIDPSVVDSPHILSKSNAEWFVGEVSSKVSKLYVDCCSMQKTALAYLMDYYQNHMDLLMDSSIKNQLNQVLDEKSVEEKVRRISEFSQRLYQHVKSFFDKQNVPLLADV